MELRNQYAFTQNNFVGQTASQQMTNLVVAQAANGEPVVKPCQADTFIPVNKYTALAHRANNDSDWQPVRSLSQLQEIVKNTPAEQLGQNLGVWTDRRSFFIFGKRDGLPQNNEVKTFTQRWDNMQTVVTRPLVDRGFRLDNTPESDVVEKQVGLEAVQVTIDPQAFQVKSGTYPEKEVGFFHETGKITQHDIYLPQDGATPHTVISHGGEQSLLDLNDSQIYFTRKPQVYVMPKVLNPELTDPASTFHTFN